MTITADLSGKTALVTGASSGLGAHFARILARSGARVVLSGRRVDALVALADDISANGGDATAHSMDVTDTNSVRRLVAEAGRIDILVNNAGVAQAAAPLDETAEGFDFVLDTNLRGAFRAATEAARSMRGHGGSIINIASILGLRQGSQVTSYAISKAGVIQMTKQLGLELARFGIRVNALAPGYFLTEMNRSFFETEAGRAQISRIPQRRLGQLSDLDGPLLLLASDASSFMTGTVITVDGGHMVSKL